MVRVTSEDNEPDILTKPLDATTLGRHLRALGFELPWALSVREAISRARDALPASIE